MPAKTESQRRLFGAALAYKRGESPDASDKVKDIANSMSEDKLEEFAKKAARDNEFVRFVAAFKEAKDKKKNNYLESNLRYQKATRHLAEGSVDKAADPSLAPIIRKRPKPRRTIVRTVPNLPKMGEILPAASSQIQKALDKGAVKAMTHGAAYDTHLENLRTHLIRRLEKRKAMNRAAAYDDELQNLRNR